MHGIVVDVYSRSPHDSSHPLLDRSFVCIDVDCQNRTHRKPVKNKVEWKASKNILEILLLDFFGLAAEKRTLENHFNKI